MISIQGKRYADYVTEKQNILALTKNFHESAIADHVFSTNYRIKWDHFKLLATDRSDKHCKIKESLFIHIISIFLVVLCQSISNLNFSVTE